MTCKKRTQTQLPLESLAEAVPAKHSEWPPAAMADLAAGRAKLIPLTKEKFALVDADMFATLTTHKWQFHPHGVGYAIWRTTRAGKYARFLMHRVILNTPKGLQTDHINGCGLDNRKCNLRIATRFENRQNVGAYRNNTTGFKGVTFNKFAGRFRAAIRFDGMYEYLGYFDTAEEAHAVYCEASKRYHGEFSRTK